MSPARASDAAALMAVRAESFSSARSVTSSDAVSVPRRRSSANGSARVSKRAPSAGDAATSDAWRAS